MATEKTIELKKWECEICHYLYDSELQAEECERIGKRQTSLRDKVKDELYWYNIKHNGETSWILGIGTVVKELNTIDYVFAARNSCYRTRVLLQGINKKLYDNLEILHSCSLWEGFEKHGLVPNMPQIKNDWFLIDPEHQKALRELWDSIEKLVLDECKHFSIGQLYSTTVNAILDYYWHCRKGPVSNPQQFSQDMMDNPHKLPKVSK